MFVVESGAGEGEDAIGVWAVVPPRTSETNRRQSRLHLGSSTTHRS